MASSSSKLKLLNYHNSLLKIKSNGTETWKSMFNNNTFVGYLKSVSPAVIGWSLSFGGNQDSILNLNPENSEYNRKSFSSVTVLETTLHAVSAETFESFYLALDKDYSLKGLIFKDNDGNKLWLDTITSDDYDYDYVQIPANVSVGLVEFTTVDTGGGFKINGTSISDMSGYFGYDNYDDGDYNDEALAGSTMNTLGVATNYKGFLGFRISDSDSPNPKLGLYSMPRFFLNDKPVAGVALESTKSSDYTADTVHSYFYYNGETFKNNATTIQTTTPAEWNLNKMPTLIFNGMGKEDGFNDEAICSLKSTSFSYKIDNNDYRVNESSTTTTRYFIVPYDSSTDELYLFSQPRFDTSYELYTMLTYSLGDVEPNYSEITLGHNLIYTTSGNCNLSCREYVLGGEMTLSTYKSAYDGTVYNITNTEPYLKSLWTQNTYGQETNISLKSFIKFANIRWVNSDATSDGRNHVGIVSDYNFSSSSIPCLTDFSTTSFISSYLFSFIANTAYTNSNDSSWTPTNRNNMYWVPTGELDFYTVPKVGDSSSAWSQVDSDNSGYYIPVRKSTPSGYENFLSLDVGETYFDNSVKQWLNVLPFYNTTNYGNVCAFLNADSRMINVCKESGGYFHVGVMSENRETRSNYKWVWDFSEERNLYGLDFTPDINSNFNVIDNTPMDLNTTSDNIAICSFPKDRFYGKNASLTSYFTVGQIERESNTYFNWTAAGNISYGSWYIPKDYIYKTKVSFKKYKSEGTETTGIRTRSITSNASSSTTIGSNVCGVNSVGNIIDTSTTPLIDSITLSSSVKNPDNKATKRINDMNAIVAYGRRRKPILIRVLNNDYVNRLYDYADRIYFNSNSNNLYTYHFISLDANGAVLPTKEDPLVLRGYFYVGGVLYFKDVKIAFADECATYEEETSSGYGTYYIPESVDAAVNYIYIYKNEDDDKYYYLGLHAEGNFRWIALYTADSYTTSSDSSLYTQVDFGNKFSFGETITASAAESAYFYSEGNVAVEASLTYDSDLGLTTLENQSITTVNYEISYNLKYTSGSNDLYSFHTTSGQLASGATWSYEDENGYTMERAIANVWLSSSSSDSATSYLLEAGKPPYRYINFEITNSVGTAQLNWANTNPIDLFSLFYNTISSVTYSNTHHNSLCYTDDFPLKIYPDLNSCVQSESDGNLQATYSTELTADNITEAVYTISTPNSGSLIREISYTKWSYEDNEEQSITNSYSGNVTTATIYTHGGNLLQISTAISSDSAYANYTFSNGSTTYTNTIAPTETSGTLTYTTAEAKECRTPSVAVEDYGTTTLTIKATNNSEWEEPLTIMIKRSDSNTWTSYTTSDLSKNEYESHTFTGLTPGATYSVKVKESFCELESSTLSPVLNITVAVITTNCTATVYNVTTSTTLATSATNPTVVVNGSDQLRITYYANTGYKYLSSGSYVSSITKTYYMGTTNTITDGAPTYSTLIITGGENATFAVGSIVSTGTYYYPNGTSLSVSASANENYAFSTNVTSYTGSVTVQGETNYAIQNAVLCARPGVSITSVTSDTITYLIKNNSAIQETITIQLYQGSTQIGSTRTIGLASGYSESGSFTGLTASTTYSLVATSKTRELETNTSATTSISIYFHLSNASVRVYNNTDSTSYGTLTSSGSLSIPGNVTIRCDYTANSGYAFSASGTSTQQNTHAITSSTTQIADTMPSWSKLTISGGTNAASFYVKDSSETYNYTATGSYWVPSGTTMSGSATAVTGYAYAATTTGVTISQFSVNGPTTCAVPNAMKVETPTITVTEIGRYNIEVSITNNSAFEDSIAYRKNEDTYSSASIPAGGSYTYDFTGLSEGTSYTITARSVTYTSSSTSVTTTTASYVYVTCTRCTATIVDTTSSTTLCTNISSGYITVPGGHTIKATYTANSGYYFGGGSTTSEVTYTSPGTTINYTADFIRVIIPAKPTGVSGGSVTLGSTTHTMSTSQSTQYVRIGTSCAITLSASNLYYYNSNGSTSYTSSSTLNTSTTLTLPSPTYAALYITGDTSYIETVSINGNSGGTGTRYVTVGTYTITASLKSQYSDYYTASSGSITISTLGQTYSFEITVTRKTATVSWNALTNSTCTIQKSENSSFSTYTTITAGSSSSGQASVEYGYYVRRITTPKSGWYFSDGSNSAITETSGVIGSSGYTFSTTDAKYAKLTVSLGTGSSYITAVTINNNTSGPGTRTMLPGTYDVTLVLNNSSYWQTSNLTVTVVGGQSNSYTATCALKPSVTSVSGDIWEDQYVSERLAIVVNGTNPSGSSLTISIDLNGEEFSRSTSSTSFGTGFNFNNDWTGSDSGSITLTIPNGNERTYIFDIEDSTPTVSFYEG